MSLVVLSGSEEDKIHTDLFQDLLMLSETHSATSEVYALKCGTAVLFFLVFFAVWPIPTPANYTRL